MQIASTELAMPQNYFRRPRAPSSTKMWFTVHGTTELRNHGIREPRNYGTTELRSYGRTELGINFFMFLPAVGLNHVSGSGKGHGYGCKACFDRQSDDAGHKCDERA